MSGILWSPNEPWDLLLRLVRKVNVCYQESVAYLTVICQRCRDCGDGLKANVQGDAAADTEHGCNKQNGVFHLTINLEVLVSRNKQTNDQTERDNRAAIELEPDESQHKVEQNFEEISAVGLFGDGFFA